ncbi:hypothetical protein QCA50_003374 [Cerrena zonata]|uniref:Monopolin complex subunit Csm1/Pcs1 C-terminal domain-containing protein n=1 Tax=Cerrena zonata TaxID=2478898 RepID=A0AAW0GME4_9APHY
MDNISSDDEFGSYNPTTPKPARKAATRTNRTSNAVAGPSSKPVPAPKRGAKKGKQGNGDDVELVDLRSDEEVQDAAPPLKKTKTAKSSSDKPGPLNAKGRGKGEASGSDDVVMVVQVEEPEPPVQRSKPTKPQAKASHTVKAAPAQGVSVAEHERLKQQVERLQKQLDERKAMEQTLRDQLEEVLRLRHTEAEEQLAREREVFEAKVEKLELLNAEQSTFISGSNSGFLHFLSREDADKEKKEAEDNVLRWQRTSAQKDEKIQEQQAHIQQLEKELKLEVDRAKTLATRNPPTNGRRGGTVEPDERTHAAVISLYESISNILVVNASVHPSEHPGREEHLFHCIYSTPNPTEGMIGALNFSLHNVWQMDADTGELTHKVEYQPKDLDKERPDLVQELEFFCDPFSFAYDQLHVFVKSLAEKFESLREEEEEEENEVEEVVVMNP